MSTNTNSRQASSEPAAPGSTVGLTEAATTLIDQFPDGVVANATPSLQDIVGRLDEMVNTYLRQRESLNFLPRDKCSDALWESRTKHIGA
jgi:hypothetical protein